MQMSGEEIIAAPRDVVWAALNDTQVLMKCIPGCESITRRSPTEMEARVVVKIGPVKAGFTGIVKLSDMDPPNGYRISGEGKGGFAGHASGGADVRLEEVPEGTRLSYEVDAQVGGKLASLGARLIDATSSALAAQFFDRFNTAAVAMASGRTAKPTKKPAAKKPVKKPAKKPVAKKPVKKPAAKKPAKKPAKKKI